MKNFFLLPLLFLLAFITDTYGQAGLPLDQQLLLERFELSWDAPAVPYRATKRPQNSFQSYDIGIVFRKADLEIRYLLIPDATGSDQELIPHLRAPRMAMHLASNDEDSYIAAHDLEPGEVDSLYDADWGQKFFFSPKDIFSDAKDCEMIALYREGVGMCYIFLLFEEPSANLPELTQLLRFKPRQLQN